MRYPIITLILAFLLLGCTPVPVVEPTTTVVPTEAPVETATSAPTAEPTENVETEPEPMPESEGANTDGSTELAEILAQMAPEGTDISASAPERGHDENVSYPFGGNPLPGGIHHPIWQKCGVYYAPLFTPLAIHAMEHGAVWLTYNPETVVGADVATLAAYASNQPFLLVSPYPEQESPIAATAWGLQLLVDEPNDERIQTFIDAFANGPQNPEPGADCVQGITETLEN